MEGFKTNISKMKAGAGELHDYQKEIRELQEDVASIRTQIRGKIRSMDQVGDRLKTIETALQDEAKIMDVMRDALENSASHYNRTEQEITGERDIFEKLLDFCEDAYEGFVDTIEDYRGVIGGVIGAGAAVAAGIGAAGEGAEEETAGWKELGQLDNSKKFGRGVSQEATQSDDDMKYRQPGAKIYGPDGNEIGDIGPIGQPRLRKDNGFYGSYSIDSRGVVYDSDGRAIGTVEGSCGTIHPNGMVDMNPLSPDEKEFLDRLLHPENRGDIGSGDFLGAGLEACAESLGLSGWRDIYEAIMLPNDDPRKAELFMWGAIDTLGPVLPGQAAVNFLIDIFF